ncbi:MAG: hypothetical protein HYY21_06330 [Candidatus Tectomicrobia bacterium]|nr:hypothetical protein [Candidatus Tectomicrobia bacterium]
MADPAEPGFLAWLLNKENSEVVRNYGVLLAALVGFPFLIWRTWATSRSAKAALKQAETATRHSVSDAFTRAIEQLGNQESLEVRLGGIYALERIARDSRRDHWPIMEVLTAFVREKAPLRSLEETDGETKAEV